MVVFRGRGTYFKRQQVADMVISQAAARPGHGQSRKKVFLWRTFILYGQGVFSALSYVGALGSAQDAGLRSLFEVQHLATQKNPEFGRNWGHIRTFSSNIFIFGKTYVCLR